MSKEVDWRLVEALDGRIQQFIGLGATNTQIRRLLDNWHIVSALANGRLAAVFEEFIPVQAELHARDVDWDVWEEKLRHFPVTIDHATTLRERAVRAGVASPAPSTDPFLAADASDKGMETLRLKVIRNRRPVTDSDLTMMLDAKLLKPARTVHLLEFVAQHPDSVPPLLYAVGTRHYLQMAGGDGTDRVEIPCVRRSLIKEGEYSRERMTMMAAGHEDRAPDGFTYPAGSTFLVIRYPLKRDRSGRPIPE